MKRIFQFSVLAALLFFSCEDEVNIDLENSDPFLVVDAWLTHTLDTQVVALTFSRPYFDNSQAEPALNAQVVVTDLDTDEQFQFIDLNNDGQYMFIPTDSFATVGNDYELSIDYEGTQFQSFSSLNPVPTIDSITFEYYPEDLFFDEEYYIGEFFARDFDGLGNTYWIKTWKNGDYLGDPDEISLVYDAGFSAGSELDGLIFILPLRQTINTFDDDDEGNNIPPYSRGDSVYVELHAITEEAWFFLSRVAEETNRPGGFTELFATPLANSPTNITSSNENLPVLGFFNLASISSFGETVRDETIRDVLE